MKEKCLTNKKLSLFLLAFLFAMYSIVYMTKQCYSAAMATLVSEGIMTKSQTGLINAVFYLVYAPFQIVGGRLADKHNPGRIIAIGILGSALANLVIYLNQNYILMIVVWGINAVFQSLIWPAIFKVISSHLVREHRKKGAFYMSFVAQIGPFLAYLIAMYVNHWQDNFWISAVSQFVLAALTAVVCAFTDKRLTEVSVVSANENPVMPDKYDSSLTNRVLFRKSGLYALIAVTFLYGLICAPKTFASVMLMESYETVSPFVGNFFFLITSVATILGSFVARTIYFRFINNEIKSHLVSVMSYVPCLILLLFVGKVPVWAALTALVGISFVTGFHFTTSFVSLRFARFGKNGEVAGTINCASAVNLIVVNYGLALLADHLGWIAVTMLGLVMAVLAGILLMWMIPRWNRFVEEYGL